MSVPKTDRNKAELVGEVTGTTVLKKFDSGATLLSFNVRTCIAGDERPVTHNVPVAWWEPELSARDVPEGIRVKVVGCVHRRFYNTPTGLRSQVEVVAQTVEV